MVQTTLMRNSSVGDDWIRAAYAACPMQMATDAQGNQNGNIITGPVRLQFADGVFHKVVKMKGQQPLPDGSNMTFQCGMLFTPLHDLSIMWNIYVAIANAEFPGSYNPQSTNGNYFPSLLPPWKNQADKAGQFDGFTPGAMWINPRSGYKPIVVDIRQNPIVDESAIYAGCWAICAISAFAGGKGTPQKGPMWGLQSIMKIADDDKLGGGAPNVQDLYGGVNIGAIAPPVGGVQQAFANMPNQQPGLPPPMPGMPNTSPQGIMGAGYGQHNAPAAPPVDPSAEFM